MNRGPLVRVVLGAAVLTILASGCGDTSSPAPSVDRSGTPSMEIPTRARLEPATGRIVLPLDAVLPNEREQTLLLNAQDIVLEKCMSEEGHTFPALERKYTPAPSRRYGVWTMRQARTDGYSIPDDVSDSGKAANSAKFSDEASQVLRECTTSQEFRSVQPDGVGPVQQDEAAIFDEAFSSPRVQRAFSKWKNCMQDKGYTVGATEHPLTPTGHVDKRSIEVATTDVQCKNKTQFVQTISAVEANLQSRYMKQHRGDLEQISAGVDTSVATAKRITGR